MDSSSRPVVLKIGRYSSSANGPFHFQLFFDQFFMNELLFIFEHHIRVRSFYTMQFSIAGEREL